jgi:hypothetical protein
MRYNKELLMSGPLFCFLANDHERLNNLLQCTMTAGGMIDLAAYAEFRVGLLTHISLEGKILLPAAQRWQGGATLPMAAKLRLDHGVLATLLVPTPTPAIIAAIRTALAAHNALEEPRYTSDEMLDRYCDFLKDQHMRLAKHGIRTWEHEELLLRFIAYLKNDGQDLAAIQPTD